MQNAKIDGRFARVRMVGKDTFRASGTDKLCVGAEHDRSAAPPIFHLVYSNLCEGQGAADLVRGPLDLDLVTVFDGAQVGGMNVDRHATGIFPRLRRDGQAPHPINDGGRDGAMQAASAVHVRLGQRQATHHVATCRRNDTDVRQQKGVDGRSRQLGSNKPLNVHMLDGLVLECRS